MARMKPAALLAHSKRKKGVSKTNPAFAVLLLVFLLTGGILVNKRRSSPRQNRKISAGESETRRPSNGDVARSSTSLFNSTSSNLHMVLKTSAGDIEVELFGASCPRTVENFVNHSKSGYFEGLTFHRVVRGFMIQGGDPQGDGTGGRSIWGGTFRDEIVAELTHEAFTLSMANSGVDSNGSQFFITSVATPWLDGKHTVFGRVVKGQEVVKAIEIVAVDANNKPIEAVVISSITALS